MENLVITNNPLVKDAVGSKADVDFREGDPVEILKAAAQVVDKGAILREDPSQTLKKYYKSMVLFTGNSEVNENSKAMIDRAVAAAQDIEIKKPALDGAAK
ncbi:MAG: hypothetical protein Q4C25_07850, partial [Bacillota bacterium]|nr:hypothetical protein [Bacillota bacterium]